MTDRPTGWDAGDDPTVSMPAVGDGDDPPTEVVPPVGGGEPPERRPGWIIPVLLVLVVVLAGALAWVLLTGDDDGDDDDAVTTTSLAVADTTTSSTGAPTTTTSSPSSTATTTAPSTTTPTTAPSAPAPALAVTSIEASEFTCPGSLVLSWTTEGATAVEVAIDTPGGVYDTGPPQGSMDVPAPCGGDAQSYYVTALAENGDRSTQQLLLESG